MELNALWKQQSVSARRNERLFAVRSAPTTASAATSSSAGARARGRRGSTSEVLELAALLNAGGFTNEEVMAEQALLKRETGSESDPDPAQVVQRLRLRWRDAWAQWRALSRQWHGCSAEMRHVLQVLQAYVTNTVLHVAWSEWEVASAAAHTIQNLRDAHEEYIAKVTHR
jgi:hypothetical protein